MEAVGAAHPGKRVTLWCQDEARVGQKGRVCHRWFTRGQRPPGLCDQRYTWAHLFAAVRPATGQGFALVLPGNVTLVPLPPYSPQLNPVERVWLHLRERHLSHRLLDGYDAIVDACCAAWNQPTPQRLRSLTSYPYLQQVTG